MRPPLLTQTAMVQPAIQRVRQISESHCGPAVLQMQLAHLGIKCSQQVLTHAIQAERFIHRRGMRIDEMAEIVESVAPQYQLWYKEHAHQAEVGDLLTGYHYPVGVEWQGLFYDSPAAELEDTEGEYYDFGHYAIVRQLEPKWDHILVTDPYPEFAEADRRFSLKWFKERWWDFNQVVVNNQHRNVKDEQLIFLIVPKSNQFPQFFGMLPGRQWYLASKRRQLVGGQI